MTEEEFKTGKKLSNPKDALGIRKVPTHVVPAGVMMEVGLAMLEGACKYGSHNYRVIGVRASTYYDAARRHQDAWWEGEDTDPDSQLNHITKAIASLVVLRDAMMTETLIDDRPPPLPAGWITTLNQKAGEILDKYPERKEPFTAIGERGKKNLCWGDEAQGAFFDTVEMQTTGPLNSEGEFEPAVSGFEGMIEVDGVWVMDHTPRKSEEAVDNRRAPGS